MRAVLLVLAVIALLLAAGAIAPVFLEDPGLVTVHFRDWTIQTSVLVLLLAVLVIWLLAQFVLWLWKAPAEAARRVQEKRATAQLEKGLLALTEGDWTTAERALSKSASAQGRTTARYLAAAQAAHGQEASERRDFYLEQADTSGGRKRFLVELSRARMLTGTGHWAEALPILEDLHRRRRKHPQVLELLARCHRELDNWEALRKLVPDLRKSGVLDAEEADELVLDVAAGSLEDSTDAEELQKSWKQLPRNLRHEPRVVGSFAATASRLGVTELAEPALRQALNANWSEPLVLRYGDPSGEDATKRLKQCEKWLQDHPEDAALQLALGRLCVGRELWGNARQHFIRSLELQPTSLGYECLGQLLERQGELETAMVCFRNALRVNQGQEPIPLPLKAPRVAAPTSN